MKTKGTAVIIIIGIILVAGILAAGRINYNRVGAQQYYTRIEGEGIPRNEQDSAGEHFVRYEYNLEGYAEKGDKSETLNFTANKQLREGAYLLVYVKENKGVTSYQEVQPEEIPATIQKKF